MTGPKVFALRIIAAFVFALNFTAVSAGPLEDATAAERQDDYVTAIPIYRALAEKGVVKAYNRLGYLYYIGVGVKRDWVESAKWYSKAVDAGDESAAGSLGGIGRNWHVMYRTPLDPLVYQLVETAAKKGIVVAEFSLGVMNYPIGDPTFDESKGNLGEAMLWYRRAAEQGDFDSQITLGLAYATGIGVPQGFVEAHKWYNLAASRSKYPETRAAATQRRSDLAKNMTPEQIAEAQKLAREWKPNKQP